jgi:hypothetical protein
MKNKLLGITLIGFLIISIFLTIGTAAAANTVVIPSAIEGTLFPGETQNAEISVALPPSSPKGDVVFLFDTTGSMQWIITSMQQKAIEIMSNIQAVIPDTAFGVASFADYPNTYTSYGYTNTYGLQSGSDVLGRQTSDYPYRQEIDITSDTSQVSEVINSMVFGTGNAIQDFPESYSRAIFESLHFSWRDGAKHIVVLIGDAPPHSSPSGLTLMKPWAPSEKLFLQKNGGDPGPDQIMFTSDDLDYGSVVEQAKESGLCFVIVDCLKRPTNLPLDKPLPDVYLDTHNSFRYLASETNGATFPYTSDFIANDIAQRIQEITSRPIGTLSLSPDASFASWFSWTPTDYYNVPWGTTKTFNVDITIPTGTQSGYYSFNVNVVADGVSLGTVTIREYVLNPLTDSKVTGGGQISSGTGDATFALNVQYKQGNLSPKGNIEFVDHSTNMIVKGIAFTGIYVSPDKTQVVTMGTCSINGVGGYTFKVFSQDNGEPGKADTFTILLSNGFRAGGTILNGNVQIHK